MFKQRFVIEKSLIVDIFMSKKQFFLIRHARGRRYALIQKNIRCRDMFFVDSLLRAAIKVPACMSQKICGNRSRTQGGRMIYPHTSPPFDNARRRTTLSRFRVCGDRGQNPCGPCSKRRNTYSAFITAIMGDVTTPRVTDTRDWVAFSQDPQSRTMRSCRGLHHTGHRAMCGGSKSADTAESWDRRETRLG